MNNEVVRLRDRLNKVLKDWLHSIRARQCYLAEQQQCKVDEAVVAVDEDPAIGSLRSALSATSIGRSVFLSRGVDNNSLGRISGTIRAHTTEIKSLMSQVKHISAQLSPASE